MQVDCINSDIAYCYAVLYSGLLCVVYLFFVCLISTSDIHSQFYKVVILIWPIVLHYIKHTRGLTLKSAIIWKLDWCKKKKINKQCFLFRLMKLKLSSEKENLSLFFIIIILIYLDFVFVLIISYCFRCYVTW